VRGEIADGGFFCLGLAVDAFEHPLQDS
jgi:hypothetical protein